MASGVLCAPGKAEKKKWKELKLLKKLEKQRMRELAEKEAEQAREEEQKEDRGGVLGARGGAGRRQRTRGSVRKGTVIFVGLLVVGPRALTGTNTTQQAPHDRPLLTENPSLKSEKQRLRFSPASPAAEVSVLHQLVGEKRPVRSRQA